MKMSELKGCGNIMAYVVLLMPELKDLYFHDILPSDLSDFVDGLGGQTVKVNKYLCSQYFLQSISADTTCSFLMISITKMLIVPHKMIKAPYQDRFKSD